MMLGANPSGSSAADGFLDGKIYSARVYNKALTQAEIDQNIVADDGEEIWYKASSLTVRLEDGHSGLATGASMQYGWSTSLTTAPSGWTTATIASYSAGASSTTFTATTSGLTGIYYLWVKPVTLGDVAGNYVDTTLRPRLTKKFYLDNTEPYIDILGTEEDEEAPTIVQDGLIRHYDSINNTGAGHSSSTIVWKDLSGNYDATITGATFSKDAITLGENTSSYATAGTLSNIGSLTLQLETRVNEYSTSEGYNVLIGAGYPGPGDQGFQLYVTTGGKLEFTLRTSEAINFNVFGGSGPSANIGEIMNVALAWDGSTGILNFWLNGNLYYSGNIGVTGSISSIGTYYGVTGNIYIGDNDGTTDLGIEDADYYSIMMYDRALTSAEINQNLTATRVSTVNSDGLIRNYDAVNNTGYGHSDSTTIWKDLSGNYDAILSEGVVLEEDSIYLDEAWVNCGVLEDLEHFTFNAKVRWDGDEGAYILSDNDEITRDLVIDSSGKVIFSFSDEDGYVFYAESTTTLEPNTIYDITATYDNDTIEIKLYINGVCETTVGTSGMFYKNSGGHVLAMGADPYEDTVECYEAWGLNIYSARIYNRALTDYEVYKNQFATNEVAGATGASTWSKTKEVRVRITDSHSGLATGAKLQYGWSTSSSTQPTSWTTTTITGYSEGANNVTFKAKTEYVLTGKYYLWVKPVEVKDISIEDGNLLDPDDTNNWDTSDETYWLDNTKPTITLGSQGSTTWVQSRTVGVSIEDDHSGLNTGAILQYGWSLSNTEEPKTWIDAEVSDYTAGTNNPATFSAVASGISGKYYLWVKPVYVYDISVEGGNGQENTVISTGTFYLDCTKPYITFSGGVTDGLIRHYDATNNTGFGTSTSTTTWKDLSGHQDGTINGATASTTYVSFDGTDDWANLGEIDITNAVTLEATIEFNSLNTDNNQILCNMQNGGVSLRVGGTGYLSMRVWDAETSSYIGAINPTIMTTGTKYHVVGIFDGTSIKVYVNGILKAEESFSGTYGAPTDDTVMAMGTNPVGSSSDGNAFTNMKMYSARIYNRALTAEEINQNITADGIVNPDTNWYKERSVTVNIIDTHSGLREGTALKYGWSTSYTTGPSTWIDAEISTYTQGANSASFTASAAGLTGEYYLWIQPPTLQDVAWNTVSSTSRAKVTKKFKLDNTAPNIEILGIGTDGDNGIVTDGLLRYYSAVNNTGYGHVASTTTWKDLSGNHDATIYGGATFEENYIALDGINDYINLGDVGGFENGELTVQVLFNVPDGEDTPIFSMVSKEVPESVIAAYDGDWGDYCTYWVDPYVADYESESYHLTGGSADVSDMFLGFEMVSGYIYDLDNNSTYGINEGAGGSGSYDDVEAAVAAFGSGSDLLIGVWNDLLVGQTGIDALYGNLELYTIIVYNRSLTQEEMEQNRVAIRENSEDSMSAPATTWSKTKEITVKISDSHSGLATGAQLKYGWSTSNTTEPTTWTTTTITGYSAGANSATFTAIASPETIGDEDAAGKYYLWVEPIDVKDTSIEDGNSQTDEEISTILYWIDNEKPTITLGTQKNETWSKEHTVTVTIADAHSGLATGADVRYGWSTSASTEPTNWFWKTLTGYSAGANSITFTVTDSKLTGKYYLWVKGNSSTPVKDLSLEDGNSQTDSTLSTGTFWFDNTAPEIAVTPNTTIDGNAANKITSADYGGYVTNYTPSNNADVQWRIFHTDGTNIYLIADDYISASEAPDGAGGSSIYENDTYCLSFDDIVDNGDYTGSADITSSHPAKKWLSQFTYESTSENMQATAYLLDTDAWSIFEDGTYAEYAIGAPTIELFAASYNTTHSDPIETKATECGYTMKLASDINWENSPIDAEGMYSGITSRAFYMWLASPSDSDNQSVMSLWDDDFMGGVNYVSSDEGIRPVVALKAECELEKQDDGTYLIVEKTDEEWRKEHSATVTITDEHSGIAEGTQVAYGWSTSAVTAPSSYTTTTVTGYTAGANTATLTVTNNTLSGKYYLWVKPVTVKDTSVSGGNAMPTAKVSTAGAFSFDNIKPTISILGSGITAANITVEDYGKYVTNYTPSNGASVGWRIFHSDGTNIYLIADDYVDTTYIPEGRYGTEVSTSTSGDNKRVGLLQAADYTGSTDITTSLASKWLSKYINSGYTNTEDDMKATAYLVDTNQWSGFEYDNYAEYVIGGPTLELFVESYNKTHPTQTIDIQVIDALGYQVKWNSDTDYSYSLSELDTLEDLYAISDTTDADRLWGASPIAEQTQWYSLTQLLWISSDGSIACHPSSDCAAGIRPIVALKADVQLEKQANGNYIVLDSGSQRDDEAWSKTKEVTVTIEDGHSGLAEGAKLQYGWSESLTTEPTTWTTLDVTGYEEGANNVLFTTIASPTTIGDEDAAGKYYLWVQPLELKDTSLEGGNEQTEGVEAGTFWIDNKKPTITLGVQQNETWSKEHTVTVTIEDAHSGLAAGTQVYYGWSTTTEVPTTWERTYTSTAASGTNSITFTVTNSDLTGKYYLWVRPYSSTSVKDLSLEDGNSQTDSTLSTGTFWFDNTAPEIAVTPNTTIDGNAANKITSADYGGYVTNYTPSNNADVQWRIFHTDGTNIYLIADDYVSADEVPDGAGGSPIYENDTYNLSFDSIVEEGDYTGSADITSSNPAKKWLSQFTYESTYPNMQATAYLMDTDAWSVFEDGTYAEYAIGGPTIELFAASYNATHTQKIDTRVIDETGYYLKESTDLYYAEYLESLSYEENVRDLYIVSSDRGYEMWLATPSEYDYGSGYRNLIVLCDDGCLEAYDYEDVEPSIRPVVALKAEYELEKQADGTYLIVEKTDEEWRKAHSATVTLTDEHSGIALGTQIQYGWSTSSVVAPDSYTSTIITGYAEGANTATFTIEKGDLSGKYYLWVKPLGVKDTSVEGGNAIPIAKVSTAGAFSFDNTAPTIALDPQEREIWAKTHEATVTITDTLSGIATGAQIEYQWVRESEDGTTLEGPTADGWTEANVTGYAAGDNTATYTVITSDLRGKYYLWVKAIDVKDISLEGGNAMSTEEIVKTLGTFWFDYIAPSITILPQENTTWRKAHTATITIADEHCGLATGAELKYGWSLSTETEPESYTTVNPSGYTAGTNSSTFTVSGDSLTGKYYLWVVPVTLEDIVGNALEENEITTGTFYFDNTEPEIKASVNELDTWRKGHTATVTVEDVHSGLAENAKIQYQWVKTADDNDTPGTPTASGWSAAQTFEGYTAGTNSATLLITNNDYTYTGKYHLFIKVADVNDTSIEGGNVASTETTASTEFTFWFDNTKPTIALSPNAPANTDYVKGGTAITVTAADAHAGLITNSKMQYQWVLKGESTVDSNWTQLVATNTAAAGNTNFQVPASASSALNGIYNLYIREDITEDNVPETTKNTNAEKVSGDFYFDNTAPEITIEPNSRDWARANTNIEVVVEDKYGTSEDVAGLPANMTIEYQWVLEGNEVSESGWKTATGTNAEGALSTRITVATEGTNGIYYLYIREGAVDAVGNATTSKVQSQAFKFDNTKPTVSFEPNEQIIYSKEGAQVNVTLSDSLAGLAQNVSIQYQWVKGDATPAASGWSTPLTGTNEARAASTVITVPQSASEGFTGIYYLYIKAGTVRDDVIDTVKNTNDQAKSGSFYFDNTETQISFSEPPTTWVTGAEVTVTARDVDAGLKANAQIKYQWATSTSELSSTGWTTLTASNAAKAETVTWTVPKSASEDRLSGIYYLYIKEGVEDAVGNLTDEIAVSESFKFDNTKPQVSLSPNTQEYYTKSGTEVTVTIEDAHAGLAENVTIQYQWATSSSALTNDGWKQITGTNAAGAASTTRVVPGEAADGFTGEYYLFIKAGCVRDNVTDITTENVNDQAQSQVFRYDNARPTVSFEPNTIVPSTAYYRQTPAIVVTLSDLNAGLAQNVSIQYQWATSSATLSDDDWATITGTNTAGATTTTRTVPVLDKGFNGDYYLFIKAGCVVDNVVDTATENSNVQSSSAVFHFDNVKPEITITPNEQLDSWSRGTEVTVKAADYDAGLIGNAKIQYQWVAEGSSPAANAWTELTATNAAEVDTVTWTVPKNASSTLSGDYRLYIKSGITKDNVLDDPKNTNDLTVSGIFQFDNEKPTVVFTSSPNIDYHKGGSTVVISAYDQYAGLIENAELQYQWVLEGESPDDTKWSAPITGNGNTGNAAGEHSVEFHVPMTDSEGLTGDYRLYIKSGITKDNITDEVKNTNDELKSGKYYFDNTKPIVQFNPTNRETWSRDGVEIELTISDVIAGLGENTVVEYQWAKSEAELTSNWLQTTNNVNEAGAASSIRIVPASSSAGMSGEYYLFIKQGCIKDNVVTLEKNENDLTPTGPFYFDNTGPVITFAPDSQGDYTRSTAVTVTATDPDSGLSASAKIQYQWVAVGGTPASGSWATLTSTNTAGAHTTTWTVPASASSMLTGQYNLYIKEGITGDNVVDTVKNTNLETISGEFNFDNTAPTISDVAGNPSLWTNSDVTLTITSTDSNVGLHATPYSFDNGATWQASNQKTYAENTTGIIIKVRDALENVKTYATINITKIDKTSPVITFEPNVQDHWSKSTEVTVKATDTQSGLIANARTKYQWVAVGSTPSDSNWTLLAATNAAVIGENGQQEVTWTVPAEASSTLTGEYRLYIKAGETLDNVTDANKNANIETYSEIFHFDNSLPVITFTPDSQDEYTKSTAVTVTVTDEGSGLTAAAQIKYQWVAVGSSPVESSWATLTSTNAVGAYTTTWTVPAEASSMLTGQYKLYIKAGVTADNVIETVKNTNLETISGEFNFDNTKPVISDVTGNPSLWTNSDVTLTITATDANVGLHATPYSFDNGATWQASNQKTYAENTAGIIIKVRDALENVETYSSIDITKIDKTSPVITFNPSIQDEWTKQTAVTVKATDTQAGLIANAQIQYQWVAVGSSPSSSSWTLLTATNTAVIGENGAREVTWLVPSEASSTLTGEYKLYIRGGKTLDNVTDTNKNANVETYSEIFHFDNLNPIPGTLIMKLDNQSSSIDYLNETWTKHDVYIQPVDGSDAHSGHNLTSYSVTKDGESYLVDQTVENTLTETGTYVITVTTTDNVGNSDTRQYTIKIDKVLPVAGTLTMKQNDSSGADYENDTWINKSVYIAKVNGSDTLSGHLKTTYDVTKDGESFLVNQTAPFTLETDGEYVITVTTEDKSGTSYSEDGNKSSNSYIVKIDKTKPVLIITGEATGVTSGLIRHYDAQNNLGNGHSDSTTIWKDLSGNYDAQVNGGTFTNAYIELVGTGSNWVNLGEITGKDYMTLEASIKLNAIQSGETNIIGNYEDGGMGIQIIDGKATAIANIDGNYVSATLDEVLDMNRIYNMSATYDGTSLKLYIDGIVQAETAASGTIKDSTGNTVMALGANTSGAEAVDGFASIKLYSARVYGRALTQAEIKQNLNADRISPEKLVANNDSVTLSFVFTEGVTGFDETDITITNGTKGTFTQISNSEYTLNVTGITAETDLTAKVAEDSYIDRAANTGNAPETTRTRDTISPSVTITSDPSDEITKVDTITYTFTFSEPVVGFTIDDVQVTNGIKGTFTKITNTKFTLVVTNDGTTYQTITIPAGTSNDDSGNLNLESSKSITIDRTKPTIIATPDKTTNAEAEDGRTVTSQVVTITVQDTATDEEENSLQSGISSSNVYEYYLSQDATGLVPAEAGAGWKPYTSGTPFTIGTGLTGTYYLFVKQVSDNVGNISETNGRLVEIDDIKYHLFEEYVFDNSNPTIQAVPDKTTNTEVNDGKAVKEQELLIRVTEVGTAGLSSANSYQYYLSSSAEALVDGEWTNYRGSESFTIGTGLTGTYYLFVKPVKDTVGNESTQFGAVTTIGSEKYHMFSEFVFDNSVPVIEFEPVENLNYQKAQSTVVTINDVGTAGINTDTVKYIWMQGVKTVEQVTAAVEAGTAFASGDTITKSDGTGNNFFLWVIAKDKLGNTHIASSNQFYLDNTRPTVGEVSLEPSSETTYTLTISGILDRTGTGAQSGVKGYYISTNSTPPTESTAWAETASTTITDKWIPSEESEVIFEGALERTIYYIWSIDKVGNISAVRECDTNIIHYEVVHKTENIRENGKEIEWFETFEEAIAAAGEGDTVKVVKDVTDETDGTIDKSIILDPNGFTLTKNTSGITVNSGCTLEITGTGTITSELSELITVQGNLKVTGATIDRAAATAIVNKGTGYIEINGAGANIKGKVYTGAGDLNLYSGTVTGDIYGGTLYSEVDTVNILLDGATVKGSILGGNGTKNVGTANITLKSGTLTNGDIFGGNNVGTANITVDGMTVRTNIYGGGNVVGTVTNANINIKSGQVNGSVYGGSLQGGTVQYSNITIQSGVLIKGDVYGGGEKAAIGSVGDDGSVTINITGGTINGSVYGGSDESTVYGNITMNIGKDTVQDDSLLTGSIIIGGNIYGGGSKEDTDYTAQTVVGTSNVNIDKNGHNTFTITGSIFGSGEYCTVQNSNVTIKNFGAEGAPYQLQSIQRVGTLTIDSCNLEIIGVADATNQIKETAFTLNRIGNLKIKNGTTLHLRRGFNQVEEFNSLVDVEGTETKATVNIENGTITSSNVTNRVYVYEGVNLIIAKEQYNRNEAITEFGKVNGMTFFGMYARERDESVAIKYDLYDPTSPTNGELFKLGSYVEGIYDESEAITVDGFYTNVVVEPEETEETEGTEGEEGAEGTEETTPTIVPEYIDVIPYESTYQDWILGTKTYIQEVTMIAQRNKDKVYQALPLDYFTQAGTEYNVSLFSINSLEAGVSLIDKTEITTMASNSDKANTTFALTLSNGAEGWKTQGETSFYTSETTPIAGTMQYITDDTDNVPYLDLYLYNSINISKDSDCGLVSIIFLVKQTVEGDPTQGGIFKVAITINIKTMAQADLTEFGTESQIIKGKNYELFVGNEIHISQRSSMTFYSNTFPVGTYADTDYRAIVTSGELPLNTEITMIDYAQQDNPIYYYYKITSGYDAVEEGNYIYKLSNFKLMGTTSGTTSYTNPNSIYASKGFEEYRFIFDFKQATVEEDIIDSIIRLEVRDATTHLARNNQTTISIFNLYKDGNAALSLSVTANAANNYDITSQRSLKFRVVSDITKQVADSNIIEDTFYDEKQLGISVAIYKGNNRLPYEKIKGTYVKIGTEEYYPDLTGTIRIYLADNVVKVSKNIEVIVDSNVIETGEYKIRIENFASYDGQFYGLSGEKSSDTEIRILDINHGLQVEIEETERVIDASTGKTYDGNTTMNIDIKASDIVDDANIRMTLYRRDVTFNEDTNGNLTYAGITYTEVDLQEYVSTVLTLATEAGLETTHNYEYLITDEVAEETLIELALDLEENLPTGGYKLVFGLYGGNTCMGTVDRHFVATDLINVE